MDQLQKRLKESTQKEVDDRLSHNMTQLPKEELLKMLDSLGYKIDKICTFNYTNNLNRTTYKAKSINFSEKDSGLSFAHVDARRNINFEKLQETRLNCFVFDHGRIWDL